MPAEKESFAGFRSEWYGGLIIHTNGWGGNLTKTKFKTYKKSTLFNLDIVNIKHPKEFSIRYENQQDDFGRSFKYGKVNSLYNIRLGYGKKHALFEKMRIKGVDIFYTWSAGANLGLVKPIYLEILNSNGGQTTTSEKYDPSIHNSQNIFGSAKYFKGFGELNIEPGGHFKTGFNFFSN